MRKPTGLVLTGGSLRGICAQAGALAALEAAGARFDAVVGVSAGAVVGALYASGRSAAEVRDHIASATQFNYIDPDLPGLGALFNQLEGWTGLLRGRALGRWIERGIAVERIEDCAIPLHLVVTNVSRGIPQVKSEGPLAAFARASASVPFLFQLTTVDDEYYADGGIVDNVPIQTMVTTTPAIEQILVLTSLRLERDQAPPVDNSFLTRSYTPFRAAGRIVDALAERLEMLNFDADGRAVTTLTIRTEDLDFFDADRIGACVEEAFGLAQQRLADDAELQALVAATQG